MNEHYFQRRAKQIIGLLGYISGIVMFLYSLYLAYTLKSLDNIHITALSLVIFYLSDLSISSYARMEILLKIIKKQEVIQREVYLQKEKSHIQKGDPINLNISAEDLIKSFNDLGMQIQKAITVDESMDKFSLKELNDMLADAITKEDYEKATLIRNEIKKRDAQ